MKRKPDADHPGVAVMPPFLYAGAFALVLLLEWGWTVPILPAGIAGSIGWLLIVIGLGCNGWGVVALFRSGTAIDPRNPASSLLTTGPFRFSRNPLYVGLNVAFVGLTLVVNTLWGLLVLVPVLLIMHYGVVLREERHLTARFGDEFRDYRRRVRRYI